MFWFNSEKHIQRQRERGYAWAASILLKANDADSGREEIDSFIYSPFNDDKSTSHRAYNEGAQSAVVRWLKRKLP